MKAFDISVHQNILFQILKDIYSDTALSPFLGFKGGTAAWMFYGLGRFSVDIDFDLLDDGHTEAVYERVAQIARKYGALKEAQKKRFSLLFVVSYEDRGRKIKIEINRRSFGSRYEIKTYLGVSMRVMVREDMFAHKLMAMVERVGKTSRDIYDVWFFLDHRFPIHREIVEQRAGMPFQKLLQKCINQLARMSNRNILDGLGELLTPRQKDWARSKLRSETLFLLKARLASEKQGSGRFTQPG